MREAAAPVHPEERHLLIDALRGFALAGVLLANLGYLSLYELMTEAERAALPTSTFDAFGVQLMEWLVNIKAITVFSLLFGLGFAVQIERAGARGEAGLGRFLRRLFWLAVIGALHAYLLWWGDILLIYAVIGLVLVLFRRAPDALLLWGGLFIAVLLPTLLQPWMGWTNLHVTRAEIYASTLQALLGEDPRQAFLSNARMANWSHLANWTLFCFVLGRFLIGYWAGRRGLLQRPMEHRALLVRLLWITAALAIVSMASLHLIGTHAAWPREGAGRVVRGALLRLGPLAMGCAYAIAFALLFLRPRWVRWLGVLAPVGRMALTLYLLQSLIGVVLFYGIGFGIGPWRGVAVWWLAWLLIFGAQIAASHWWLARFRYGPCEWAWRSLTYGAWQPMRLPRLQPVL